MSIDQAVARHRISNLLHGYTAIADRKDIEAVVDLLGHARVRFPAGGSEDPGSARTFFARLWSFPEGHRHDVNNLVVEPGEDAGTWRATAHYTRWILSEKAPLLHTLGQYELLIDGTNWSVAELTVTRIWTTGG